jgi:hypothetical protein
MKGERSQLASHLIYERSRALNPSISTKEWGGGGRDGAVLISSIHVCSPNNSPLMLLRKIDIEVVVALSFNHFETASASQK